MWSSSSRWCCSSPVVPSPRWCCSASRPSPASPRFTPSCRRPPGPLTAIGAGSVFFSHLNDAGFWLVREYFGMSVGQTLKTWSLMETILSVVGLGCVMLLSLAL
uniref:GntT/GntP/DsdX family permease n=1 Tax=Bifidobacterium bifidum TaxID=1681 RepID=UPI0036F49330